MKRYSTDVILLYLCVLMLECRLSWSSDFVFPKNERHRFATVKANQKTDCKREYGVCVGNVPGYPNSDTIRQAMERYKGVLTTVETRFGFIDQTPPRRIEGYSEACLSYERTIFPQEGEDSEGMSHYVVNDEDHQQPVIFHACSDDRAPCNIVEEGSKCDLQERFVKMFVMNSSSKAEIRSIRMPSHCSCYVNETTIGDRFGFPNARRPSNRGNQHGSTTQSPATIEGKVNLQDNRIRFMERPISAPVARRLSQPRWRRSQAGMDESVFGGVQSEVSYSADSDHQKPLEVGVSDNDGHELSLSVPDQQGSSEIVVNSNTLRIRKGP